MILYFITRVSLIIVGLIVALFSYKKLLQWLHERPHWFLAVVLAVWPVLEYARLQNTGLDYRPVLALWVVPMSTWIGLQYLLPLWRFFPHLRFLGFFAVLTGLYFVFFNQNAVSPTQAMTGENSFGGSLSLNQLSTTIYCAVMGVLAAHCALNVPKTSLDFVNKALVVFVLVESVVITVLAPLFTMEVDGFNRLAGLYKHPNMYAHRQALLLLYLMMVCAVDAQNQFKLFSRKTWAAVFLISLLPFLLALSKTAIAACVISAVVFWVAYSRLCGKTLLKPQQWALMGLVGLVATSLFALVSGQGFLELVEARVTSTSSLEWRYKVWGFLMKEPTLLSTLFGHGLTAANKVIYELSFHDAFAATPLINVHNAYVQLYYDFGLLGFSYWAAILALMGSAVMVIWKHRIPAVMLPCLGVLAMSVHYLIASGFDETLGMFNAPIVYWLLATLALGTAMRARTGAP
jgi:hypothetical protein